MYGAHSHINCLYQDLGDRDTRRPGFHDPFQDASKRPKSVMVDLISQRVYHIPVVPLVYSVLCPSSKEVNFNTWAFGGHLHPNYSLIFCAYPWKCGTSPIPLVH